MIAVNNSKKVKDSFMKLVGSLDQRVLDVLDISEGMSKMWEYVKKQKGWSLVATFLTILCLLAVMIPASIISDLYPTYRYATAWSISMASHIPPFLIKFIFYLIIIGILAPTVVEVAGSRMAKKNVGRLKPILFLVSCWDFVTDREIVGMIIDSSFMSPLCGNIITSSQSVCDSMGHYTFVIVRAVLHATGIFVASYGLEAVTIILAWGFAGSVFLMLIEAPGAAKYAVEWVKNFKSQRSARRG